jgi:vesicle-fusing ATPase
LIGTGDKKRRAGERTLIYERGKTKSWLQYGGPERKYEAVDMGPCALVEILALPKGLSIPSLMEDGEEMVVAHFPWDPNVLFDVELESVETQPPDTTETALAELNEDFNQVIHLESTFQTTVGGLRPQIQEIVRRVLDGRVIRPLSEINNEGKSAERVREAEQLAALGLQPVKGLLLYGPPGCGKTQLSREISRALDARPPKIVAAPELLDRWVGGSEKLVRELFADAEAELVQCNGDPTKSALHVIVIDEVDAVFRKRTAGEDSAQATRASAVNQILAKLDGVNVLGNVLLIGMTNRRELLDDALLRPGRLEVQIEIPLPDKEGRREILQIHFDALRRRGRLSEPLCQAIDGVRRLSSSSEASSLFWRRRRAKRFGMLGKKVKDLASSRWTGGFSGADIAGLVRCAGSIALARARSDGTGVENLLITLDDVVQALDEVRA